MARARGAAGRRSLLRALVGGVGLVAFILARGVVGPGARAETPVPEPETYRVSDYRAPVPATLAGADVLDAEAAQALWEGRGAIFIDVHPRPPKPENLPVNTVWRDPVHKSIEGAAWLPNVGYGVLAPAVEAYFATRLVALTVGDKARRLVFFCERDCWMSWNAAKRALALGYRNVAWFPEGTDAWRDLELPLAETTPVP
jgi:PQQ-dependent catabolism-associated CXXCW motif protein